jgi:hypothetical protein
MSFFVDISVLTLGAVVIVLQILDLYLSKNSPIIYKVLGLVASITLYIFCIAQYLISKSEQEILRTEIQMLSNRTGTRKLTEESAEIISGLFEKNTKIKFELTCVENDQESCDFAKGIEMAVNKNSKLGVSVKPEGYLGVVRDILVVSHTEESNNVASAICKELKEFGCVHKIENPKIPSGKINLIVGSN